MRTLWMVGVCVMALALGGAASAEMVQGQVTTIGHPMMSVSGTGTVEIAPDTARVTASIITEGETVEQARERNAQIAQRAMAAVKALKLPNATTKTLDYTMERVTRDARVSLKVDPAKWDIPWKVSGMEIRDSNFDVSVPVTLGYRAANSLTVRLQGTREELSAGTGKVIDALMAAGTNQITSVAYSLEKDDRSAMREALTRAMKDAQATAEAVAAAAGRKIVGVRSINPGYARPYMELRQVQATYAGRSAEAAATPTSVTAGMLEVTATVSVSYELDYNAGDTKFLPAP
ncbi:MAG TPA: SIMPL domain-containing protein [Armatimonadota bacterium]|nr:SIMPL domain-containing protein [Armatimonadota bacterium]